jgi:endoglucanase
MRRAIRIGLFLFAAFTGTTRAGVVKAHGALQAKGHQIVDAGGSPIQLAGMSLYWSTFGTNATWGANQFFNANVVSTLANDWKSTLVRAPAGVVSGSGQNVYNYPSTMNLVKTVVDAAIANDIYVIVDWHLENNTPELSSATQFFTEMTQTYKNTPNIIWEIWNEPKNVTWADIKSYANTMIPLIRKNSSNLIVVGTPNWSHNPDQAANDPITIDANVAYTFHFYADQNSNGNIDADNNTAMGVVNQAIQKVPLMITEWGTVGNSGSGNVNSNWSDKWLAWAKTNNVSWANWSLSNKSESSAALSTSASTNGGWNDGSLSASGKYVKGKIQEVVPSTAILAPSTPASFRLSARRVPDRIQVDLPDGARSIEFTSMEGRVLMRRNLSGERSLLLDSPTTGVLVVRATTDHGSVIARLAPIR